MSTKAGQLQFLYYANSSLVSSVPATWLDTEEAQAGEEILALRNQMPGAASQHQDFSQVDKRLGFDYNGTSAWYILNPNDYGRYADGDITTYFGYSAGTNWLEGWDKC